MPDLLGDLLRGRLVHVNVIPLNPTPGSIWTASTREQEDVVRRASGGQGGRCDRPGHPRPGDRRRLRPAGRHGGLMRDIVILGSTGSIGTQATRRRCRAIPIVPGGRIWRPAVGSGLLREQVERFDVAPRGGRRPTRRRRRWRGSAPRSDVGPHAASEVAGLGVHTVLERHHRRRRPAADAGRAAAGRVAGTGQQGVADRRRRRWSRPPAAPGPDRAGRLRALRAGPVPARRRRRGGAPAGAHRQRRAVPRPQPRASCST